MKNQIPDLLQKELIRDQHNEIDAYYIYSKLSTKTKDTHNAEILLSIALDEMEHYKIIKNYTKKEVKPSKVKIFLFILIARLLGFTFALKLLEKAEQKAQDAYKKIGESYPKLKEITRDEERHELELIDMLNEERLTYIGSVVLGLNDALVELTGALAGFTFALQNSKIIGVLGLITGIAASLSMGASEYLSSKHEEQKNPVRAAGYTAIAYIMTVIFLIFPFLVFVDPFASLILTLVISIGIIAVFNFYVAVAKDFSFKNRFIEMAGISLGVAGASFLIGVLVKTTLGAEI
ncbi:MAG: VIT1/CCC1 transporter family protein [Candidatus Thermoplasmatota archaeon]|nr:VIT1/CCC1 transporter family protein [Candidatus Thermoplasmatota archaeon]